MTESNTISFESVPLDTLEKILECPVCLKVVTVPFKLCQNGHPICSVCMNTLPSCPSCNAPFTLTDPVCIKNILETLPRKCPYSDAGCEELNVPEAIKEHQRFCGFRPAPCQNCGQEVPVFQFEQHFRSEHDFLTVFDGQSFRVQLERDLWVAYYELPMLGLENMLWLGIKFNDLENYVFIHFDVIPVGKPTRDYFIIVKFLEDDVGLTVHLKAREYGSNSKSEVGVCSLEIPARVTDRCVNEHGSLVVNFEIFSRPKQTEESECEETDLEN